MDLGLKYIACITIFITFCSAAVQTGFSQQSDPVQDTKNAPSVNGEIVQEKLPKPTGNQELTIQDYWKAARNGELEKVKSAIKSGIKVDEKTEYGATALFFACDRGNEKVAEYLLSQGADPNAKDTFYKATPVIWAQMKGHNSIVLSLLKNGGEGADDALVGAVANGDVEFVEELLQAKIISEKGLIAGVNSIKEIKDEEVQAKLKAIFEPLNIAEPEAVIVSKEILSRYVGKYANEKLEVEVTLTDESFALTFGGGEANALTTVSETAFSLGTNDIFFTLKDEKVVLMTAKLGPTELKLKPVAEPDAKEMTDAEAEGENKAAPSESEEPKFAPTRAATKKADRKVSGRNWPGFRGNGSRGIADGQSPPVKWSIEPDEKDVLWKTPIPGLGLSCPTIWGNRIYVTTAVTEGDEQSLKIGLYGDVDSVEEEKPYEFKVLCYSKLKGKLLWEKTATTSIPKVKRHAKSSHANPTVATNGKHVVAFFGSEGLYCYSKKGELIWKKDLGFLDSGWFYDPGYQWGFASSPVIHQDKVIVQCDNQGQSFVAAFSLESGEELWRTQRDEIPTWSTPLVHEFADVTMLITNGTKSARGYNVENGELLWSLKEHSEIVVPTPNVAHGLIYVSSGYSPIKPIYVIKPEARGDISLPDDSSTNESVKWSMQQGGPYMPTPIIYGDYMYCCDNAGILSCYFAESGEEVYRKRIKTKGGPLSFTASPIASDGHIYLTAEDGRVLVIKAGPEYDLAEVNKIGESTLATPAISQGAIFFRTQNSLIAVGKLKRNKKKEK